MLNTHHASSADQLLELLRGGEYFPSVELITP